ncbi:hypothetical protein D3C76_1814750 [compost metagenome]
MAVRAIEALTIGVIGPVAVAEQVVFGGAIQRLSLEANGVYKSVCSAIRAECQRPALVWRSPTYNGVFRIHCLNFDG